MSLLLFLLLLFLTTSFVLLILCFFRSFLIPTTFHSHCIESLCRFHCFNIIFYWMKYRWITILPIKITMKSNDEEKTHSLIRRRTQSNITIFGWVFFPSSSYKTCWLFTNDARCHWRLIRFIDYNDHLLILIHKLPFCNRKVLATCSHLSDWYQNSNSNTNTRNI